MDALPAAGERDPGAVLAAAPDIVLVLGADGEIRYANAAAQQVLGIDPRDVQGSSVLQLLHPDDVAVTISSLGTVRDKPVGTPIEVRIRDAHLGWRWMEVLGADRTGVPGVDGIVCVARDLTARRMWEVAGGDVATFQQVLQHAPAMTLLLDATGVVTSVNGAFTRLLGHDPSLVVGRRLASFATESGAEQLDHVIRALDRSGRHASVEVAMRTAGPLVVECPVRLDLVDLRDDPVVAGIVVSGYDVSDLHSARQALEHLAHHDALTGLANRSLMLETLHTLVDEGRPVAVLFADLDRFKPVNDLYGHDVGDELLRAVANRLRATARPDDLVARVGGDEFVIVAPGVSGPNLARRLADRLEELLSEPYALSVGPVRIGVSLGVSVADRNPSVATLLGDADLRMYDVKADRRGDGRRTPSDRRRSSEHRRRLADDLAAGLDRGEVVAFLQPIVDLATDRVVAVEALARWHHSELGLLSPASFLELAEDAMLGTRLGRVVAASAFDGLVRLRAASAALASVRVCLNVSVEQLSDPTLTSALGDALEVRGVSMGDLVIEVTERATLTRAVGRGSVSPEATLLDLHRCGAGLSLDDFGTGHSSLTHVRQYPLESIKVDRSFVGGMLEQPGDRAVVEAVVGLGVALGLRVVAEGVESAEQADALRRLGCHEAQGYALGVPRAIEDLLVDLGVAPTAGERSAAVR